MTEKVVKINCSNCGQDISNTGICSRCDEICSHCDEKRREHPTIGIYVVCPKSLFEHSGNYRD